MEQERIQQPAPSEMPTVEVPGVARVRGMLGALEQRPDDEALATSFNRAVSALARQRSPDVFEFLRELADLPLLRLAKDSNGVPCRAAVLAAWVELGYPWALELPPEDHAWLRQQTPGRAAGWLSTTFVLAVISALVNVGAVVLFLIEALTGTWAAQMVLLGLPFAAMGAHALGVIAATQAAQRDGGQAAGRLRVLGYAGLIAPLIALGLGVMSAEVGLCLMVVCLPFTASALVGWGASQALARAARR